MAGSRFPPIDRLPYEPGADYTGWGRPVPVAALFDGPEADRTPLGCETLRLERRDFPIAPVATHDYAGPEASPYRAGEATVAHGIFALDDPVMILPNGAMLLEDGETLVAESCWQSQLHLHPRFRFGPTTRGRWRTCLDLAEERPRRDGEVINCYHRFHHQYFHWFIDCLPRLWLLRDLDRDGRRVIVGDIVPGSPQDVSMQALGLSGDDLYDPDGGRYVSFSRMLYPVSKLQESLHVRPSFADGVHYKGGWDPVFVHWLNDTMRRRYARTPVATGARLYVDRRGASHRRLANSARLHAFLEANGFDFVDPGAHPFEVQVAMFSRAELVVGAHGAGLANILWCDPRRDVSVIEVGIRSVHDTGYTFLSSALGLRHEVLFGTPLPHRHGPAFADLDEDEDKLIALIRDRL